MTRPSFMARIRWQPIRRHMFAGLLLLGALLALTGCSGESPAAAEPGADQAPAPEVATATPQPPTPPPVSAETVPTATPAPAATATPAPEVEVEPAADLPPTDWLQVVTRVEDYYWLGNPDAPVRLIDYSDFL